MLLFSVRKFAYIFLLLLALQSRHIGKHMARQKRMRQDEKKNEAQCMFSFVLHENKKNAVHRFLHVMFVYRFASFSLKPAVDM